MIKGYIFGFLYIVLVASSTIWLNSLGKGILIPILLFYTSLSSIVIFNLANLKHFKRNHASILNSKKNWVYMSCALVLIWYFTYYCTIHSSAEFFIATAFLTTALISALAEKKGIKIFACIISLSLTYFYSKDATLLTLLSAIVAGIAGYIYYRSSYQFSKQTNMNALSILSIRFYFVLIFAMIYILGSGTAIHLKISAEQAFLFLIFSLVNMVIPAFFSQTCLHSIGVSKFSFLNTLIPTLTFFLEAIFNGVWQTGMLVACLFATLTLNLSHIEKLFKLGKK